MNFIKSTLTIILLSLFIGTTSCDSDDKGSSEGTDFGSFQLNVSGDFEATKSGFADFDGLDAFGVQTWEISMNDDNPSTISLQFMLASSTTQVTRPSTGTYEIGFDANSTSVFSAIYTHIPDGNFMASEEYTTLPHGYGGTLTITSSSDDKVEGSFDFSVAKTDENFNVSGEITVSGQFSSRKRIN